MLAKFFQQQTIQTRVVTLTLYISFKLKTFSHYFKRCILTNATSNFYKFIILGCLGIFSSVSYATTKLSYDASNGFSPSITYPFNWSERLYSSIDYQGFKETEVSTLGQGFGESRISTSTDNKIALIRLVGYKMQLNDTHISLGVDYKNTRINKQEFGFFQLPSDGTFQTFTNDVGLKVDQMGLSLAASKETGRLKYRLSGFVSGSSNLSLNQETRIKPIINSVGTGQSNTSQSTAYKLDFDIQFNVFEAVDLVLTSSLDYLPLDYQLKTLSATGNGGYEFINQTISAKQTVVTNLIKLHFNSQTFNGIPLMIGAGTRKIQSELNGGSSNTNNAIFVLGFEKLF